MQVYNGYLLIFRRLYIAHEETRTCQYRDSKVQVRNSSNISMPKPDDFWSTEGTKVIAPGA